MAFHRIGALVRSFRPGILINKEDIIGLGLATTYTLTTYTESKLGYHKGTLVVLQNRIVTPSTCGGEIVRSTQRLLRQLIDNLRPISSTITKTEQSRLDLISPTLTYRCMSLGLVRA